MIFFFTKEERQKRGEGEQNGQKKKGRKEKNPSKDKHTLVAYNRILKL